MDCEICGELLIDYYYAELEPDRLQAVAAHLTTCSQCAKEYCRLHASLTGISLLLDEGPRPAVQAALRAKVEQQFSVPWWRKIQRLCTVPVPLYQAAMVVVLLIVTLVFIRTAPRVNVSGESPLRSHREVVEQRFAPAQTVFKGYDASQILRIDPSLL